MCSPSFIEFGQPPFSRSDTLSQSRPLKHKKQRLVLNKNWKHVLNRISNFKKKLRKHTSSVKNCETKASQSNKTNKTTVSSSIEIKIIQYLVFGLSVVCLPGLIILYLAIPKIQIFTKFLYKLSDDWLENMVFSFIFIFHTLLPLHVFCHFW